MLEDTLAITALNSVSIPISEKNLKEIYISIFKLKEVKPICMASFWPQA